MVESSSVLRRRGNLAAPKIGVAELGELKLKTKTKTISKIESDATGSLFAPSRNSNQNAISEKKAVAEIRRLHGEIENAARKTLTQAIRVGELLDKLKKSAGHGKWQEFIKEHLPFSMRTAQNYLAVYK